MASKFKNLFFVSDEKEQEKLKQEKFTSKFPDAATSFPTSQPTTLSPPPQGTNVPVECGPHMDSIMKLYEDGFAGLNRPGIEFYEFFESVMETGVNDPGAYKMALKILGKMQKDMTPQSLITQSQYYIDELTKVHTGYNSAGIKKKEELTLEKNADGQKLTGDISSLKQQIESLKNQLTSKELQLSQIDDKYQPKINELDCKIMANNEAKNRILSTINTVITGIKNNL